jgi:AhpD family alkylhydroperoxidase
MQLERWEKELAAIGASIGSNCRPCAEHHIPAGREAGLSEAELVNAVATARAVRDEAIELLAPRIDELLGGGSAPSEPALVGETSRAHALTSLGASMGVNSHPLLRRHIAAALELGLSSAELAAAARTAVYVQQCSGEMTAEKATDTLAALGGGAHAREPKLAMRAAERKGGKDDHRTDTPAC